MANKLSALKILSVCSLAMIVSVASFAQEIMPMQSAVPEMAPPQNKILAEVEGINAPDMPAAAQVQGTENPLAIGPGEKVIPTTEELGLLKAMDDAEVKALSAPYVRPDIRSLMFTPYQYKLLLEAQKGFSVNVTNKALGIDDNSNIQQAAIGDAPKEKISAIREISLGGILYTNEKSWTIYLNNERITPENLPKPVVDIKVFKDHIKLLWLDLQTNKIYPILLKTNERFNIDSKFTLPGKSG